MPQPVTTTNKVMLRSFWHVALLFCGILGPLIFLIVYFTFGDISPDFDMLRQPIGDLELMSYGWIQSVNFVIYGLFTCAFGIGLYKELQSGFGLYTLPATQICLGLSAILLGIFIHEPAHTYISFLSAAPLVISFLLFARRFAIDPGWKGWAVYGNLCALASVLFMFLYWYTNKHNFAYAGIFEHMIIITRMVWLAVFVLELLNGRRLAAVPKG